MTIQSPHLLSTRVAAALAAVILPATLTACSDISEDARNDDVAVTTSALTVVINVSTVAQLYAAFAAANSSSNTIEIHLAPGVYSLTSPSDSTDTISLTHGSLKVLRASNVKLIGGRDISDAWNYVIDGGWSNGIFTSLLYVGGTGNPRPSLSVTGVSLGNSFASTMRSPVQVVDGVFSMTNSHLFNTQTQGQGGGGLYVNNSSSITLSRCSFTNNSLFAALGTNTSCGGNFDDGGSAFIANSSAFIENSTFMYGLACRGGGLYLAGSPSNSFTINQSTFTGNQARTRGGGIMVAGSPKVSLNFNTITGNFAGLQGARVSGELHIAGGLSIANLQLVGGGFGQGSLRLFGNIIAQNDVTQFSGAPFLDGIDCYLEGPGPAPTVAQNGNLIGERGNFTFLNSTNLVGTHEAPLNAQLHFPSELGGGFGGEIFVEAPLSYSPALHAYPSTGTASCFSTDQLGIFRGSPCSIGSVDTAIF